MDDGNHMIKDALIDFRFHPFMHVLIPFFDDSIRPGDLIYVIPHLGHGRDIKVCNWIFENKSTGETFESYLTTRRDRMDYGKPDTVENYGGMQGWFIAPQEPVKLNPGYYNIGLRYLKGGNMQEFNINSAFLLEK